MKTVWLLSDPGDHHHNHRNQGGSSMKTNEPLMPTDEQVECQALIVAEAENGTCPDCGRPTYDDVAIDSCGRAPVWCWTCDWRPCEGGC